MTVNYKIIAGFTAILILLAGCLDFETQLPVVKEPQSHLTPAQPLTVAPTPAIYVMCDDYVKITDRYKTPEGFYIVVGNETVEIDEKKYENTTKGGYAKIDLDGSITRYYYEPYTPFYIVVDTIEDLVAVTESESGYRFACRAVRE